MLASQPPGAGWGWDRRWRRRRPAQGPLVAAGGGATTLTAARTATMAAISSGPGSGGVIEDSLVHDAPSGPRKGESPERGRRGRTDADVGCDLETLQRRHAAGESGVELSALQALQCGLDRLVEIGRLRRRPSVGVRPEGPMAPPEIAKLRAPLGTAHQRCVELARHQARERAGQEGGRPGHARLRSRRSRRLGDHLLGIAVATRQDTDTTLRRMVPDVGICSGDHHLERQPGPARCADGVACEGEGEGTTHARRRVQAGKGGVNTHDQDDDAVRVARRRPRTRAHSGMFPCFFGGSVSRFVFSSRSARTISTRVSCGMITASTYPRSAAM